MANPAPTINQINAFNATQGTTIDFNIIGGTELIRSNRIYIYDLSDNSLICTHLYVSTESIHELPPNTDGSIVYESGKSSADFVNGAQYYAQIQTYTDTNGTQGGSGLSVAKMFWCLGNPTLTITTIPSTISTTSYNVSATYTDTSASVVSNIIQQYQFNLYSATGSLLQSSGVVVGSGTQQGTSNVYDISHNFTGLNVGSSYYVAVNVTTTQGMSVNAQSNTFTVSIDTPTLGEATVVNNACDGYISVTSNLSGEYGGSGSGEIVSFETDSENVFSKLQVDLEPIQEGSGDPSPSNVRPIRGHGGVDVNVRGKNLIPSKNSFSLTANGITLDYDGEVYHIYGTNTKTDVAYGIGGTFIAKPNVFEPGVVYTVSTTTPLPSGLYLGINTRNSIGNETVAASNSYFHGDGSKTSNTFTCTQDTNGELFGFFGVNPDCGTVDVTFKIQLEEGSTATPYEPYQQPQTITQDFNATLTPTSTDTTPYSFKAVGDVYGDRLEDKIVGGTVAWNQFIHQLTESNVIVSPDVSGLFDNGTVTFTQIGVPYANIEILNTDLVNWREHYYLVSADVYGETANDFKPNFGMYSSNNDYAVTNPKTLEKGKWVKYQFIKKPISLPSGDIYIWFFPQTNAPTSDDVVKVKNLQVFDLTQMFGSTIADYIYSLEQSQAGAGVAWFKKLFPNDYYAYNAGELLSVEGLQSHDTVGFNQWDEEWRLGYYAVGTGALVTGTKNIASKNPIPVLPSTTYFFKNPVAYNAAILYYDKDMTYLGYETRTSAGTCTTPQGAAYAHFYIHEIYGTTYNHDICINFSDPSRNGEYEPYKKHSYPLDSSLTLRGLPKLDASNNLYYDGDEYTSDGKVKRKYGTLEITSGMVSLAQNTYSNIVYARVAKPTNSADRNKATTTCIHSTFVSSNVAGNWNDASKVNLVLGTAHYTEYWFGFASGTTLAQAQAALTGTSLVYELATPTTETATPYTNPQIVSKYGTLEYVTNSIVPVGHKTTYLTRDIFGGYVDLISGKLVVDRKIILLDGTQSFGDSTPAQNPNGGYNAWFKYDDIGMGDVKRSNTVDNPKLSNRFVYTPRKATAQNDIPIGSFSGNVLRSGNADDWIVFAFDSSMNTYEKISQWFKDNNTQICYELETPQTYQLTPQQVSTLVGTNNVWSEQGNIELSYHIPITNLLVKRQDVDDVGGGWLTLYSQPITQASDMDFTFIDFLNQYGKTYKYALVPLLTQTQSGVEVEVEGGYTVSNEVQSVFDGVFIADSTGSQKCKANVGYGNVDMNQVVGSITPIGAKYPIIITNSHNQYHNGSISGTIVPDDYYFNGNLSRIDMVNKRNELEQFLTNKRVKVIKDWNGNIWLVMIVGNVSCTFNNSYGMGIVSFSTNWTEVGDPTNQQDLQATGLINVGGV